MRRRCVCGESRGVMQAMTDQGAPLVDVVRRVYGRAVIRRCREQGCRISCADLPPHVILKGELLYDAGKMCDCLIVIQGSRAVVVLVELKSKSISPSAVAEKLTNATAIASQLVAEAGCTEFEVFHVVLAKAWSLPERIAVEQQKISYGERKYDILPGNCGCELRELCRAVGLTL